MFAIHLSLNGVQSMYERACNLNKNVILRQHFSSSQTICFIKTLLKICLVKQLFSKSIRKGDLKNQKGLFQRAWQKKEFISSTNEAYFVCFQMRVRSYRAGLIVNTNNGVEWQNKDLKHEYLKQYKDNSLSGIMTYLTTQRYDNCFD